MREPLVEADQASNPSERHCLYLIVSDGTPQGETGAGVLRGGGNIEWCQRTRQLAGVGNNLNPREEQHPVLVPHRMRQQLVKFRTAQINGLRVCWPNPVR